jgi:serine/threonine protein kinase
VAGIHAAGFVWRDLKATNVILTPDDEMRPIDFEGSCANGTVIQTLWGSRGHVPAEWATSRRAEFSHDLFALGVIIQQLHTSPDVQSHPDDPLFGLTGPVRDIVAKLTSTNAAERPSAVLVAEALSG